MAQADGPDANPNVSLAKIYLKDVSLEAPYSPEVFTVPDLSAPRATVDFRSSSKLLPNGTYDVSLTLTVTAKNETRTIFLVEVEQAGIFMISNVSESNVLDWVLKVRCPNILFPYAREAVDNLVVKAGFPPLMLAPVNFRTVDAQVPQESP